MYQYYPHSLLQAINMASLKVGLGIAAKSLLVSLLELAPAPPCSWGLEQVFREERKQLVLAVESVSRY